GTRIALFADFGTGLYHSRSIAAQIQALRPDYAIHLGDVYYAGKKVEFDTFFSPVLEPLLKAGIRVFTMNGNHEMLSGGQYYFDYLDQKRAVGGAKQQQEGSYFCITGDHFQVIGMDTDYHFTWREHGRLEEQRLRDWLRARLQEGRDAHKVNILLTGDEPI